MRDRDNTGAASQTNGRFDRRDSVGVAGQTMLPSVSLPNETAAKFDEAAAPEPELEPQGLRFSPYGLLV
jgi:hypothetical protein